MSINSNIFYGEYFGHPKYQLDRVVKYFKSDDNKIIFLAGDSTLDNKFWIEKTYSAINSYENILFPPVMKGDFCYYLNKEFVDNGETNIKVVNCAREASSFSDKNILCDQDIIIRDNIRDKDILVVSIGGNDVALMSSFSVVGNFFLSNYFNRTSTIESNPASAWGLKSLADEFRIGITKYIKKLIRKTTPSKVIVCMFYYPDVNSISSWCGPFLYIAGYSLFPTHLQSIIKYIYNEGIRNIKIKDVDFEYFPMFEHIDPNDTTNYVGRVEPSEIGAERLSKKLREVILQ